MVIEKSVTIHADMETVWGTFVDLSCWKDWCMSVKASPHEGCAVLAKGGRFGLRVRPFAFPLNIRPVVEAVEPRSRAVWTGRKPGVTARHEFLLEQTDGGVRLTSREVFSGPLAHLVIFVALGRMARLTSTLLNDLKRAAEAAGRDGKD